jgi:D-xylose transport system substrate-binding protein
MGKLSKGSILLIVPVIIVVAILALVGYILVSNNVIKLALPGQGAAATPAPTMRIGLSMDTLKELRWSKDRDLMTQRAGELGASVIPLVADGDDKTQISQIENLISQKVDVLIVIAHNAKALSGVVDEAHKAGIKVIAYDRMILDSDLDLYISFDSIKVGADSAQYVMAAVPKTVTVANVAFIGGSPTDNNATLVKQGAMSVLDPLIKSGKVKLVYDQFTTNWDPDIAYKNFNQFLNGGGKVDAVVASNDGTAMGAIQALTEHGLAGKVPVSGQDAELAAVKRLMAGTQTITLYKPLKALAYSAAENAVAIVKGKALTTNSKVNNGKIDVPSVLIDPVPVTKDNIKDTVVKDGFYTSSDVYGSPSSP